MDMGFHLTGLVSTLKVARGDGECGAGGRHKRDLDYSYDQSMLYSRKEYNIVKQLVLQFQNKLAKQSSCLSTKGSRV